MKRPGRLRLFLLLLVVAAGALVAWAGTGRLQRARAIEAIRDYGGFVHFDYQYTDGRLDLDQPSPTPVWLRGLAGELFATPVEVNLVYEDRGSERRRCRGQSDDILGAVSRLTGVRRLFLREGQATDEGLWKLSSLPGLEELTIWGGDSLSTAGLTSLRLHRNLRSLHVQDTPITDDDVAWLVALPLERLVLQGSALSDEGLAHLARISTLEQLVVGLGPNQITDAGLRHLGRLKRLEHLGLQRTAITDAGLAHLEDLSTLKLLWVANTRVTDEGKKRLQRAIPGLVIF